jgi:hypothetical protein
VHNELEKILLSDEVSYNKTSIYNPQSNIYFHFFFRTLHFDDHSTRIKRRESDKFCHIRSIFEEIVKKFQENYTPGENVTLDEQLIPFRGRFSFKQYIPSKPARYGVKTFALVDSKSFYTINLETYCGTQPNGPYQVSNSTKDVVLRLARPIFGSGRNLTADNWFTSVEVIRELAKKKVSYVGTIKKNKKELPLCFLQSKNREIGSSLFGFNEDTSCDLTAVSYIPKKTK